jgi:hypothetical protein
MLVERRGLYMPDNLTVSPTPIQRNVLDVAMELTTLYYRNSSEADIEKIDAIFARFYAAARELSSTRTEDLRKYLKI